VLLLLVVWAVKAILSDPAPAVDRAPASAVTGGPVQASLERSVVLIALDTVRVKVVQEIDGKELFQGTLARGETRSLPRNGSILITASAGENLEVEVNGKRYPMPFKGWDRAKIN